VIIGYPFKSLEMNLQNMLLNNNNRLILVHVQTYVLSFHRKWPHSNTLEQNDNQLQRQYTYIVGKYKMYLYEFQKQKEKISLVGFSFLLRGEFKLYVSFYFYFYVILTASNKLNIMSEDVRDNWKRLKLPVFLLYVWYCLYFVIIGHIEMFEDIKVDSQKISKWIVRRYQSG
jgi:hypothetical protein